MSATAPMKAPTQDPTTVLMEIERDELEEASTEAEGSTESDEGLGVGVSLGVIVMTGVWFETRGGATVKPPPAGAFVSRARVGAAEAWSVSMMRVPSMPVPDGIASGSFWRWAIGRFLRGRKPIIKEGKEKRATERVIHSAVKKERTVKSSDASLSASHTSVTSLLATTLPSAQPLHLSR